jgi:hypothetical protein
VSDISTTIDDIEFGIRNSECRADTGRVRRRCHFEHCRTLGHPRRWDASGRQCSGWLLTGSASAKTCRREVFRAPSIPRAGRKRPRPGSRRETADLPPPITVRSREGWVKIPNSEFRIPNSLVVPCYILPTQ